MKKFVLVFAQVLLCALLCTACTGENGNVTTTTVAETTPASTGTTLPTPTELDVVVNGTSAYRVIRATSAIAKITTAANDLTSALNQAYGTSFLQEEDFYNRQQETLPDGAREILVGETNRKASIDAYATLRLNDFVICTRGNSIVILGGSPAATAQAVDYFIATYIQSGTSLILAPDLYYRHEGTYPYESFKLNGVDLANYRVVTSATTQLEKYALDLLLDTVSAQTGVRLQTVKGTGEVTDYEIRFGKTDRTTFTLSDLQYEIKKDGTSLNINCNAGASLAAVRTLLFDWFGTSATNHTTTNKTYTIGVQTLGTNGQSVSDKKKLATTTYLSLCDQQNGQLSVLEYSKLSDYTANTDYSWRWLAKSGNGNTILDGMNRIDEGRLRYSETLDKFVLCTTSSSGGVWLTEYNGGAKIWETDLNGFGPHSMEYLPCGYVAVACSGNSDTSTGFVRLYDITTNAYAEVALFSAHGVLWDPQLEMLWALGSKKLNAYMVGKDGAGKPTLTPVSEFSYNLPAGGGHDISFVVGDPTKLWVSGKNVVQFDKTTGKFTTFFEGTGFKATVNLTDGTILCTQANGTYAAHDTDTLILYTPKGDGTYTQSTVTFTGRAFYKARIFSDWQYLK